MGALFRRSQAGQRTPLRAKRNMHTRLCHVIGRLLSELKRRVIHRIVRHLASPTLVNLYSREAVSELHTHTQDSTFRCLVEQPHAVLIVHLLANPYYTHTSNTDSINVAEITAVLYTLHIRRRLQTSMTEPANPKQTSTSRQKMPP